jgi:hypothetical protein
MFGCDRPKHTGTSLEEQCAFQLYPGFNHRDFLENSYLAPCTHAVEKLQVCLRSGTKGTLLEEQCTLSALFRVPIDGFS